MFQVRWKGVLHDGWQRIHGSHSPVIIGKVVRELGSNFQVGFHNKIHVLCLKLFDKESELNWLLFHDVLVTSRVYVRTVCPIRYDWVKELLPKLHQVEAYELSSVAKEEVTDDELIRWEKREAAKRQQGVKRNQLDRSFMISSFQKFYWLNQPHANTHLGPSPHRGVHGGGHGEAEEAKH